MRESYREGKKVLERTIANLSEVPEDVVEGLRILLRGGAAVEHFEDSFEIERSLSPRARRGRARYAAPRHTSSSIRSSTRSHPKNAIG